jgi:hypothetical protein
LWFRTHPLNFLAGRSARMISPRSYLMLFILSYLKRLSCLRPTRAAYLFNLVRISDLGTPLASARAQATNSFDEKNSGSDKTNRHSCDVNSSQSHLRNKNSKSVVRFPDEITYHRTTVPFSGAGVVLSTMKVRNPLEGIDLRNRDRMELGSVKLDLYILFPRE